MRQLIFFIVSHMTICSVFRRKTKLIKHWCSGCFWALWYRAKDTAVFQFLILSCQQGGLEDRTRTADLNWSKGCSIPYMMLCKKTYKTAGSWPGEWGMLLLWHQSVGGKKTALCNTCFSVSIYVTIVTVISLFLFFLTK